MDASNYFNSNIFSGAGKTTLLAAISSRVRGDIQGKIKLNGKTVSPSLITKISGFVPQNDLAFEMLTVGEHMEFMVCAWI